MLCIFIRCGEWGLDLIKWLLLLVVIFMGSFIFFLQREIKRLTKKIATLSERQEYGGRLSVEFREKNLMDLVDALNTWVDENEQKGQAFQEMEENIRLSIVGLSHDLRTPLTAINGYVQLLEQVEDTEKREKYLTIIKQSVARLLSMTDQFYDLARIETKQKEMDLHTLSFSKEVEEVFFSSFYEQFSEKNIEVAFAEHSINTTVLADPLMLLRVLQNIIQNLLRYADGQAKVTFSKEDSFIRLTVANPIKPGAQTSVEKVFQRFYTENTSRTNTESSGIGLYLSKKLVEGMGGEMTARLDGGIFSISVKLRRV